MDLKILDYTFRIKAKCIGEIFGFPNDKDSKEHHNQFNVSITNIDTKKRITFKYYGSIADYNNGIDYTKEEEHPFLLYCFLSDAHSGYSTFDYFCGEFGYDTDSRSAEKIYQACIKTMYKTYKLDIETEDELCGLLNELTEKYNC